MHPIARCIPLGLALMALPFSAHADSKNFEWDGKVYTKGLAASDDSQGVVWLSNPFWDDNIGGQNGVATELELGIRAQISPQIRAGARIKSRFGAPWHLFWENGDLKTDEFGNPVPVPGDTSGESLGMNQAQYMKFRNAWVEIAPPSKHVQLVRVGATDFGMWNAWTIGKLRYINRDNGNGVFAQGKVGKIQYHAGVMAMPRLWAGPNWTTGIGDSAIDYAYITGDWAYGLKLKARPGPLDIEWITTYMRDLEFNPEDPDTTGTINVYGEEDGVVDRELRYRNLNSTVEIDAFPLGWLRTNILAGFSFSDVNPNYAYNGVSDNQGIYPMVYGQVADYAARLTAEGADPLGTGLSFQLQYFNIGDEWTSTMGARREADVLITDGFLGGGQLPTLNIANEFMDWDDVFYESIIGWHGATALITQQLGASELEAEFTHLTYNTNMQNRDVDLIYPDFLHTDGYTDTEFYDYANVGDRGRDPRAVYRENQDRRTQILVLKQRSFLSVGRGLEWKNKLKYIRDRDERITANPEDNYRGDIYQGSTEVSYQVNAQIRAFLGDQFDYWVEDRRSGTPEAGYYDYITRRNKAFTGFEYAFGGAKVYYQFQWLYKRQSRYLDTDPDIAGYEFENEDYKTLYPWRSKITFEVAW